MSPRGTRAVSDRTALARVPDVVYEPEAFTALAAGQMDCMVAFDPRIADHETIRAWLLEWQEYIAKLDEGAARLLFHPDVIGFGTTKDVIVGLEDLVENQWLATWPTMDRFVFDTDTMHIALGPDRQLACVATIWHSIGFDPDGSSFDRAGRATILLARRSLSTEWRSLHTHFSLNRGVPQLSHGARTASDLLRTGDRR